MNLGQQINKEATYNKNPMGSVLIFFHVLLSLGVGVGLFIVHVFTTTPESRLVFIAFFLVFACLLAGAQIVVQYFWVTRLWNPIKRLVKDLKSEWMRFEKTLAYCQRVVVGHGGPNSGLQ